jgi:hypothetical protein
MVWSVVIFTRQQLTCSTGQLWLVSSSASMVGQFSFIHHPQSQDISLVIFHAQFGLLPHPSLSAFVPHLGPTPWVQFLAPPLFSEIGSAFHPIPTVSGRLQFTVCVFKLCWKRDAVCLWALLDYVPGGNSVICGIHLLGLQIYARSFETWPSGRNGGWCF